MLVVWIADFWLFVNSHPPLTDCQSECQTVNYLSLTSIQQHRNIGVSTRVHMERTPKLSDVKGVTLILVSRLSILEPCLFGSYLESKNFLSNPTTQAAHFFLGKP